MANRTVNVFINNKEAARNIKAMRTERRRLIREIESGTLAENDYNKAVKRVQELSGIIDNHKKKLRGVSSSWDKIKAGALSFVGITSAAFAAQAIVNYGKELFRLGTEMEVLQKKAKTVFAETLPQVNQAARENANAMGLTVSQYTDAAAAIGDLLIPMKFTRQEAADISTNLVNLSGALSEWTGGQKSAKEVTEILGKAILGEREQLKTLGISIQEADVKTRLAEKGLKNLTGEMLQQAKAAVTLELITEKSGDAQAAFAANSDTLIRKQAELKARFQDVQESMATALIPVFHRLLEVAAPVIEETSNLIAQMLKGEKATGRFGEAVNFLAPIFRNVAKVGRFWLAVLGKVKDFLLDNFGGAFEFIAVKIGQFYNLTTQAFNGIQSLLKIDVGRFEQIDISAIRKAFDEAKKAREESGIDEPISTDHVDTSGFNKRTQQAEQNEKARKLAEKQIKQAEKDIDRLQKRVEKLGQELELSQLSGEEQALEKIRQRYQKEIELAIELEGSKNSEIAKEATKQRRELEKQQELALNQLREEQHLARMEKEQERQRELSDAELEAYFKQVEERRTFEENLKNELDQILEEERTLEIQALNDQFNYLKFLAQEHDIDIERINEAHRKRLAEVNKKFDEQDRKEQLKAQNERVQIFANSFGAIAGVISNTINLVGKESRKAAALSKILALAEIGAKSAQAIAAATASAAGVPFPANIPAIATAVGTVLANVAQAKNIISRVSVPQRKKGGWHEVLGADDGKQYRAQYIGMPGTGLLPDHPVLLGSGVLASEVGAEYFVSHKDLQQPKVLNLVRAIDNITKARQFVSGGVNNGPLPESTTPTPSNSENNGLVQAINRLNDNLEKGIYSRLDDETIINIRDRLNKLVEVEDG